MDTIEKIREYIIGYMPKEYYCHIQFVHKVACELQEEKGGNREVVEIASIAHDCGRVDGADNSQHPEIGAEKIKPVLAELGMNESMILHISRCILMHNKTEGFESIEEEIVANADQISKIIYHEAFMLLVKKETFDERARWAVKYLDKGFQNATFEDLKKRYHDMYMKKRAVFTRVLSEDTK
jgi:HD superfamily phosphodiesterase